MEYSKGIFFSRLIDIENSLLKSRNIERHNKENSNIEHKKRDKYQGLRQL